MANYTENLNLELPENNEYYDIQKINENFRKIDEKTTANFIAKASGSSFSITDGAAAMPIALSIYGASIQDGTPTPTAPKSIQTAGANGSINVTLDSSSINFTTPNGLASVGDVCDTLTVRADGTGTLTQKIQTLALNGGEAWIKSVSEDNCYMYHTVLSSTVGSTESRCDKLVDAGGSSPLQAEGQSADILGYFVSQRYNVIYVNMGYYMTENTLENLKAVLAANPLTVQFILAEPIITELSAEEVAAFKALRIQEGACNVLTDDIATVEIEYFRNTDSGNAIGGLLTAALS